MPSVQMGSFVMAASANAGLLSSSPLLVLRTKVKGFHQPLRLLIDSGASENFCRVETLKKCREIWNGIVRSDRKVDFRLTNGTTVESEELIVRLHLSFSDYAVTEEFVTSRWMIVTIWF